MRYILILLFSICSNLAWSQSVGTEGQITWSYWNDVNRIYDFREFFALDRYPNGPDGMRKLNALQSPRNFDEFFTGQMKGFISVPVNADVQFNVTANDSLQFFLSSDQSADNIAMVATSPAVDEEHHDSISLQTSSVISLVANQNYYFEVRYQEFGWLDFADVHWKTTFLNGLGEEVEWLPITFEYLKDVSEAPCSDRGTPCDDGNNNTENDQEDGNCNCIGDPITNNDCVGERGKFQQYIYEGIESGLLEDMFNAPHYPDAPNNIRPMTADMFELSMESEGEPLNYGARIQAYLSVPVTGNYSFNITGSVQNIFYLSSDETEANKLANTIQTYWWTGFFGHVIDTDWTEEQTITDVYLEAGKYYYVELVHKGQNNYSFYGVFWNGPQHPDNEWRRLPNFYLFDYTCENACVQAGIVCNDNDPYTTNDSWDGNCNCTGTPCTGPEDCDDPTVLYPQYDDCATTESLDNRADDAWLSCTPLDPNPNSIRGESHWIQYNLGSPYTLDNIHVWNYNVANVTELGFENVVIDYSMDGTHWKELGTFNWDLASGTSGYEGFDLSSIENFTAQYILITSLDPTNTCRGISKVTFSAFGCPSITFPNLSYGQIFNSPASPTVTVQVGSTVESVSLYIGDNLISTKSAAPYTWSGTGPLANLPEETYTLTAVTTDANDGQCSASIPIQVTLSEGECHTDALEIPIISQPIYRTSQTISSTATVSMSTQFIAEQSITLLPNFEVVAGTDFLAAIENCLPNTLTVDASSRQETSKVTTTSSTLTSNVHLYPNPVQNDFTITVNTEQERQLEIEVFNVQGQRIPNLTYQKEIGRGQYNIPFIARQLTAGMYYCKIRVGNEEHTTSFVKGSL